MGRGRTGVVAIKPETDSVAKDAAINKIHPRAAVPPTPMRIA